MNLSLTRKLMTREAFLGIFSLSVAGIAGLVVTIPIVAYVLGPLFELPPNVWRDVGAVDSIKIGETKEVSFQGTAPQPWAGTTAKQAAWLRRTGSSSFIAFAVYCTHLGCPVHWQNLPQIFLCPCHGSVFNSQGVVLGGPAPRPLYRYHVRVRRGRIQIKTRALPVLS